LAAILTGLGSTSASGKVGFGTEVLPKIAAIYLLPTGNLQSVVGMTRLKANYGEGIKAPSLVEAFSPSQFFLGNPLLKPDARAVTIWDWSSFSGKTGIASR
jgi:Outer membrane cobalamin receptor protein